MIVQTVTVTRQNGSTVVFENVAKKVARPASQEIVVMEFFSPLDVSLGLIIMEPGMVFSYAPQNVAIDGGMDGKRIITES